MNKQQLQNKTCLVTGGTGFIGSHMVKELLALHARVHVLDINPPKKAVENVTYHIVDLRDKEKLTEVMKNVLPEYIYHLAGTLERKKEDREEILAINGQGTKNLLEALRPVNYKSLINTSTSELYGDENTAPFKEDMPLKAMSPYSESKLLAEKYCEEERFFGKNITTMRLALAFGPGQENKRNMLIPSVLQALRANEPVKATLGEQTRDFVYVKDIAEAFILASMNENAYNEAFNIGLGKEFKVKDVITILKEASGSSSELLFGTLPYREKELWHYYVDISKARKILNWEPKMSFEEGIKISLQN